MRIPTAHDCNTAPGCKGLALWQFTDPNAPKPRKVLRACLEHRAEAERRWREATGRKEAGE